MRAPRRWRRGRRGVRWWRVLCVGGRQGCGRRVAHARLSSRRVVEGDDVLGRSLVPPTERRGPRRHRNHVWPRPTVPPLALLCVRLPSPSPNRNRSASAFPQAKVVQEVALAQVLPRAHALCPAVLQEDADWSASVDDLLPAARQMPTPAVHRTSYMSSPGRPGAGALSQRPSRRLPRTRTRHGWPLDRRRWCKQPMPKQVTRRRCTLCL